MKGELAKRGYSYHPIILHVDNLRWPESYICTVYDRKFGDFPAKNTVCTPYIYMVLANPI